MIFGPLTRMWATPANVKPYTSRWTVRWPTRFESFYCSRYSANGTIRLASRSVGRNFSVTRGRRFLRLRATRRRAVVLETDTAIANLELMPAPMNDDKSARIGRATFQAGFHRRLVGDDAQRTFFRLQLPGVGRTLFVWLPMKRSLLRSTNR
jgi:hypothetical protein